MSLANKLSLYISITIVAIFCAIGAVFMKYGTGREERLVSLYATVLVDNSVDRVNSEISRIEYHLANSAPLVERKLANRSAYFGMVERIVTSDSLIIGGSIALCPDTLPSGEKQLYMAYVSIGPDEKLHRKLLDNINEYNYTEMSWFTDAVGGDSVVWSEPYFDANAGDMMMVTCSYPLKDNAGRKAGVLTVDISLERITEELARLRPIDDSYSIIIDSKGVFMAHPDSTLLLKKDIFEYAREIGCKHIEKVGTDMLACRKGYSHTDIGGEDSLVVYEPVTGTGWSICCVCSYKSIMSSMDIITVKAVIFLFFGLLVTIILVRIVVLYSMKSLALLKNAATEISNGNLDVQLPTMKPSDDIGKLNNAFMEMQKSLRQQMERLVETTKAKEHIESELHIARSIQMSLVPHTFSPFPKWDNLELYARIRPAREVGGDLYDFFIRDSKLFFTIGDVSGKGVPASLFMAVTRTLFRNAANNHDSPAKILYTLNNTVLKDNDTCMFVTMFVGVLDLVTGNLTFCNAGHNPPVLTGNHHTEMFKVQENIPVGVIEDFEYSEENITLKSGWTLFLYTDGLTEAENPEKQLYGDRRMLDALSQIHADAPKEIIDEIEKSVDKYAGGVDQSDDLTMLCLRLNNVDMPVIHKTVPNSLSVVGEIPDFIAEFRDKCGIDKPTCERLNLVLEELLVNVVSYAYPPGVAGEIEISMSYDREQHTVKLVISDNGQPFDPTKTDSPDTDAPIEERPIGGLGIHLVRSSADEVTYTRTDDKNVLTVIIH